MGAGRERQAERMVTARAEEQLDCLAHVPILGFVVCDEERSSGCHSAFALDQLS